MKLPRSNDQSTKVRFGCLNTGKQPAARSRRLCSQCETVSVSLSSDGNQHIEFSPIALPCEQPAARSRRHEDAASASGNFRFPDRHPRLSRRPGSCPGPCEQPVARGRSRRHEAAASASGNCRFPDRHPRLSRRPGLCPGPLLQG